MNFDEEGLLDEPCLSCEKARVEDIWWEWYCDEKECMCKIENEEVDEDMQHEEYDPCYKCSKYDYFVDEDGEVICVCDDCIYGKYRKEKFGETVKEEL